MEYMEVVEDSFHISEQWVASLLILWTRRVRLVCCGHSMYWLERNRKHAWALTPDTNLHVCDCCYLDGLECLANTVGSTESSGSNRELLQLLGSENSLLHLTCKSSGHRFTSNFRASLRKLILVQFLWKPTVICIQPSEVDMSENSPG